MAIRLIHLSNGEEIMGNIDRDDLLVEAKTFDALGFSGEVPATNLVIKKPRRLAAQPTPDGRLQVGIIPFSPFADKELEEVAIVASHIICILQPNSQIEKMYLDATSAILRPGTLPNFGVNSSSTG